MSAKGFLFAGAASFAVICLATALALNRANVHLHARVSAERERHQPGARERKEGPPQLTLAAASAAPPGAASAGLRNELARVAEEIAQWERRAEEEHAAKAAEANRRAEVLAVHRDPTTGPVRVENFRNCGTATPTAAFQTLVWAAMQGDESILANLSLMPAPTRQRAEALIARQPEEARARWTPEKLARLWLVGAITGLSALEVTRETRLDAEQAVVSFRAPGMEGDENVKLKLTPSGWKVVVSSAAITKLEKALTAVDR